VVTSASGPSPTAASGDNDAVLTDEQTLQAANLGTEGPALLDFFRKRSALEVDRQRLVSLIQQLGARSPLERDRAAGELIAIGPAALPLLRQAVHDPDEQLIAAGAQRCLHFLEDGSSAVPIAATRLLAVRKTPGTIEVLLNYLPFADDDGVIEEVKDSLSGLAVRDGKPDPALLKALDDKGSSLRRVVAAEVLCQIGSEDLAAPVRKLLEDPKPAVRLRAALAMAQFRDAQAVSALVSLLGELPTVQGKMAEDYLFNLAGEQAPKVPLGDDVAAHQQCRDAWAEWWKKTDSPALLDEFRKRTLKENDRAKVLELIEKLGDDSYLVRKQAEADLVALGVAAVPLLHQASEHSDPEVRSRVQSCLDTIGKDKAAPASAVSVRLVALHKPPAAAEVLIGYLPFAEDESLSAEVRGALSAVAFRAGKPDPAVLAALDDKFAVRRAAAAEALCRPGGEELGRVKQLLQDADPMVRLRVALALAEAQDKEAIPALIAQLDSAPQDLAQQADEYLRNLAGEGAPQVALEDTPEGRTKSKDAWTNWYKEKGATVQLAKASAQRQMGYTLLLCINPNTGMGNLVELDRNNKKRWEIENLQYPWGAQVLPGNRVLTAEHNANRVYERDFKGQVLWEKACNFNPVACQRLANGNTFIGTRGQLMEVNREGKEVFSYNRPMQDIMAAQRLRNGHYAFFTHQGQYVRIDAAGKEVKTLKLNPPQWYGAGIDFLPNDHVLYPQHNMNKVVEYDADAKVVWEANIQWPTSASRLPNGHTLVSSQQTQKVTELDKQGKIISEYKGPYFPMRAVRR
jgi:HEAT repeat protein